MSACIEVRDLVKTFTFPVKNPASSWWKNFMRPDRKTIRAVDGISFTVERGRRLPVSVQMEQEVYDDQGSYRYFDA
jgi:ABC-type uncharacterized transport system ATPase subunit